MQASCSTFRGSRFWGRAALDDVGHVDLGTVQVNDLQHVVQQLAGLAHKGDALLVLVLAGSLADEHDLRRFGAVAKDHMDTGVRQSAAAAGQAIFSQGFPGIRHGEDLLSFVQDSIPQKNPMAQWAHSGGRFRPQ